MWRTLLNMVKRDIAYFLLGIVGAGGVDASEQLLSAARFRRRRVTEQLVYQALPVKDSTTEGYRIVGFEVNSKSPCVIGLSFGACSPPIVLDVASEASQYVRVNS
jgi:hypothetical protein